MKYEEYICIHYRYTYGQPVRGRADIAVSIQPYQYEYDRSRYGMKRMNVEVSITVTLQRRECALNIALTKSIFSPKCTKYRLAAGLHPNPLGELGRSPRPVVGFKEANF